MAILFRNTLSSLQLLPCGIAGTWSPVLNNGNNHIPSPDAGQCTATATVCRINPSITPTFKVVSICSGATLSSLPATSFGRSHLHSIQ